MSYEDIQKLFKFNWGQLCSDHNGKTSPTAVMAMFLVIVGGIGFLYALWIKNPTGELNALGFATLGTGLLGYRKSVNGKPGEMGAVNDTTTTDI